MRHAIYVLSGTLKRAIRDSGLPQTELAARICMAQTRLSALLRDTRFNDHTKALVITLGATLGVSADECCKRVGRERQVL
jgi:hypothetical protein